MIMTYISETPVSRYFVQTDEFHATVIDRENIVAVTLGVAPV